MIESSVDIINSVLRATLIGSADIKEVCSFIEENYPRISFGILWDFSKGDLSSLSNKDFKTILTLVDRVTSHKSTAYVVTDLHQFGLIQMYTTLAEINRVPPMMKTFKTLENAEKWLNEAHSKYSLKKSQSTDINLTSIMQ